MSGHVKGTSYVGINLKDVRRLRLPIPPLALQHRTVAELGALLAEIDALKRLQSETAEELDALLPAVLDRKRNAMHRSIGFAVGVVDSGYDIYNRVREIRRPELRSSVPSSSWPEAEQAGSASWSWAAGSARPKARRTDRPRSVWRSPTSCRVPR